MKKTSRIITIGRPSEISEGTPPPKVMIMPNVGNGVVLMANETNYTLIELYEFGQHFGHNTRFSAAERKAKEGTYWQKKAQSFLKRFNDCTDARRIS